MLLLRKSTHQVPAGIYMFTFSSPLSSSQLQLPPSYIINVFSIIHNGSKSQVTNIFSCQVMVMFWHQIQVYKSFSPWYGTYRGTCAVQSRCRARAWQTRQFVCKGHSISSEVRGSAFLELGLKAYATIPRHFIFVAYMVIPSCKWRWESTCSWFYYQPGLHSKTHLQVVGVLIWLFFFKIEFLPGWWWHMP